MDVTFLLNYGTGSKWKGEREGGREGERGRRERFKYLFLPRTWVFGPPSRQRVSVTFFVCAILFWGYPMYYWKVIDLSSHTHHNSLCEVFSDWFYSTCTCIVAAGLINLLVSSLCVSVCVSFQSVCVSIRAYIIILYCVNCKFSILSAPPCGNHMLLPQCTVHCNTVY